MRVIRQIVWWIVRSLGTLAVIVLVTVLLAIVLLYSPIGEALIAKKGGEYLSDVLEKKVDIGEVGLDFPLALTVGQVSVEDDDSTLAYVRELKVNVGLIPLLEKKIEIKQILLDSVMLHTEDMIDAVRLDGYVGKFTTAGHVISLDMDSLGYLSVPMLKLKNTDLLITLNDSVPEDTTEEESFLKRLRVGEVIVDDVSLALAHEGRPVTQENKCKYPIQKDTDKSQKDIVLAHTRIKADSICYATDSLGMSVACDLKDMATMISGEMLMGQSITLKQLAGVVDMFIAKDESLSISLKDLVAETTRSKLTVEGELKNEGRGRGVREVRGVRGVRGVREVRGVRGVRGGREVRDERGYLIE